MRGSRQRITKEFEIFTLGRFGRKVRKIEIIEKSVSKHKAHQAHQAQRQGYGEAEGEVLEPRKQRIVSIVC